MRAAYILDSTGAAGKPKGIKGEKKCHDNDVDDTMRTTMIMMIQTLLRMVIITTMMIVMMILQ